MLMCIVRCASSINGIINCSLGDDGVLSYEDTCSFTRNTGYELTGSDIRTCQSDGSWSGSNDVCRRGMYIYRILLVNITRAAPQIVVTLGQSSCSTRLNTISLC